MSGENKVIKPKNDVVRISPNRLLKLNLFLANLFLTVLSFVLMALLSIAAPLLSFVAVLLFIGFSVVGMYRLLDLMQSCLSTALLANEHGIRDNTGPIPGGLVRWDEISEITTDSVNYDEPVLLLNLHHPDTYLDRLPKPKRSMLATNVPIYGTPCVVSQRDIGLPVAEAQRRLEEVRQRHVIVPVAPSTSSTVTTAPVAHWWTAVPPEERKAQPLRNGSSDR